jgi:3-isopropylmalate/(R)-2-methylmalate dehydratase small subunit
MAALDARRVRVEGRGLPLPGDDIDTDRIIPARFLREITFEALGRYAFIDERIDENGATRDHPLNDPRFQGVSILLVNRNFGCGSSREHAPQSLLRMGIQAFVGESFAEIFSGNCTALGLPAARVSHGDARALMDLVTADPGLRLVVDLDRLRVSAGAQSFAISMPESDRASLMSGEWDSTSVLLSRESDIRAAARRIPYVKGFSG